MKKFFFHTLLITLLVSCGGGGGGGGEEPQPPSPPVNNESTNVPTPSGKEIYVQLTPNRRWNDFNASVNVKILNLSTLAMDNCKKNADNILKFICLAPNIDMLFLAIGKLNNKIYLSLFSPIETTEVELNEETTQEVLEKNIVQIQNGTIQVNTENIKNLTNSEKDFLLNIFCDQHL